MIDVLNIKGLSGFAIAWSILMVYSIVMNFYDFKIAVLGIIMGGLFGFLGFDMFGDLIKKINKQNAKWRKEE